MTVIEIVSDTLVELNLGVAIEIASTFVDGGDC